MAADLDFDVEVVGCPIVREADGLAKSSRNVYLSATVLSRSIFEGQRIAHAGMAATELESAMKAVLAEEPLADVEYVTVVDALTMQPIEALDRDALVAMAVRIGRTRLIDNFSFDLQDFS